MNEVARIEAAAWQRQFGEKMRWADAMAYGLRRIWDNARALRSIALTKAADEAERVARAALSDREAEIAGLRRELFAADFIDSTPACFTEKASITARLFQLGA